MKHRLTPSKSGDHHVLLGPYDEGLVAELKRKVPASHREWRPVAKCWRIRDPFDQTVRDMLAEREGS